jgi:tRNA A58 N-methylase Trm61
MLREAKIKTSVKTGCFQVAEYIPYKLSLLFLLTTLTGKCVWEVEVYEVDKREANFK